MLPWVNFEKLINIGLGRVGTRLYIITNVSLQLFDSLGFESYSKVQALLIGLKTVKKIFYYCQIFTNFFARCKLGSSRKSRASIKISNNRQCSTKIV